MRARALAAVLATALVMLAPATAGARDAVPLPLQGVGFEQRLGATLPPGLHLRDEAGRTVDPASYWRTRPVLLALVYYRCPMLCSQVEAGLVRGLQDVTLEPGRDFDVVFASIDPHEGPSLAAEKKRAALRAFGRPGTEGGWHFLTGDEPAIRTLAEAIGFTYRFDPATGQFAHAAGVVVVGPGGRIARCLFGIEFPPRELRLSLVEASQGAIARPIDAILLYCFCWDPSAGRYGVAVMNLLRAGGAATVAVLGATLLVLSRRKRRGAGGSEPAA